MKQWNICHAREEAVKELSMKLHLPPIVARVMAGRGYDTVEKASAFLSPEEKLSDPFSLCDMDKAVARVKNAMENAERIVIYGDYDCDGIMSTVLLYRYLESMGADVRYYIPSRDNEGYGMNKAALRRIRDDGATLVITVDNGITALEEIDYANEIGLDVVITDHHKPRSTLPNACAIVDPHRDEDKSGCVYLAGVGVAFKLVCALEDCGTGEWMLEQFGDLVAVATIADIVPLVGENRIIVRSGLARLQSCENEGLDALISVCGLKDKVLNSENIAFGIVPRINSAGRFDCVDKAMELFVSEGEELHSLATEINSLNEKRRNAEEKIFTEIFSELENDKKMLENRVIVLHGKGWHHGIVGIVASRMVDKFGKPCIVLSEEDDSARGSGRSVQGFSIIDAINACSKYLTHYGGHNQAAGVTMPIENISSFTIDINEWAKENFAEMPRQILSIDCVISPKELSIDEITQLSQMEPFGAGNETPVFCIEHCAIQGIYPIGGEKHLRLRLGFGDTVFFAVYFGMTQQSFPYNIGDTVDLAVTLDANEWQGEKRVSVKIRDMRLSGVDYDNIYHSDQTYQRMRRGEEISDKIRSEAVPTRDDIAVVYRYIRAKKTLCMPDDVLFIRIGKLREFCKMKIAMDVLDEMRLIDRKDGKNVIVIENPAKVDLMDSSILQSVTKSPGARGSI